MDTTESPTATTTRPQVPAGPPPAQEAPAEQGRRSPVVRMLVIAVAAVVVLFILIAGIRYLIYASAHETTDDAKIDSDQVQITSKISERVDRIVVDTNQYVRKGQLLVQLDDRDERSKLADAIATRDGYGAQANAARANVALTLDQQAAQNEQNRGAIQGAQAAVNSAGAQARSAQSQIDVAQAGIADARAQLDAAKAAVPGALESLRKAQADLRRTTSLVSTGDESHAQLDSARAAEQAAQSSYDQTQANAVAAEANVTSAFDKLTAQQASATGAQATIGVNAGSVVTAQGRLQESASPNRIAAQQASATAAEAQVAVAQTQVNIAKDNLSYTKIRSPIDGYVGQKNAELGQTVSPGETLMTIVPSNDIYVTANYKETQMRRIRVGQPVDINVDAYNGVKFDGYVDNISPASQNSFALVPAQNASGNFVKVTQRLPVRVRFRNPDPHYDLRPGMSVETSVKVK
jgi:membrane fusion protein (multidrug efflux system)